MNKVLALAYDIDLASICATDGNSIVDEPNAHDDTASTVLVRPKRQRVLSARTRLGVRTLMGGLLSHDDVGPTFFNYLPCKDVLTLRQSCKYWRDLPFNHVVLRCLRPAIHFSPDEELKLFKLFYRYTTANPAALSKALSLLESDPSFEKAQKDHQEKRTSFATLLQNPGSITAKQEQQLIDLYHLMNDPDRQQDHLRINVLSMMRDNGIDHIDPDTLHSHIQQYINHNLKIDKTRLFKKLYDMQESNDNLVTHTDDIRVMLTEHPILIVAKNKKGSTPLLLASKRGMTEVVTILLNARADVAAINEDGDTPLHKVIRWGHPDYNSDVVKALLEAGADMGATDNDDWTPLHYATGSGNTDTVTALLEHTKTLDKETLENVLNACDNDGYTPLHEAAYWGIPEVVAAFLEAGAEVNAKDKTSWTPLHFAVLVGKAATVNVLLTAGAKMNAKTINGYTPLHVAAKYGELETRNLLMTQLLIRRLKATPPEGLIEALRSPINFEIPNHPVITYNPEGNTAIYEASEIGQLISTHQPNPMTRNLLTEDMVIPVDYIVTIFSNSLTSLTSAIERIDFHRLWGNVYLNDVILRCVSPISTTLPDIAQRKDELRLLHLFHKKYRNHPHLLDILKQDNAFISAQGNYMDCYKSYTTLLENPGDITTQQEENLINLYNSLNTPYQTPLLLKMHAVNIIQPTPLEKETLHAHIQTYIDDILFREKEALFQKLRERPIRESKKAVHATEISTMITQHPILIATKDEEGYTPLHVAAQEGKLEVSLALIAHVKKHKTVKTALNTRDVWGQTPLHCAAWEGQLDVTQAFLARGADVTAKTKRGTTPLQLAKSKRRKDIVALLQNAGATK